MGCKERTFKNKLSYPHGCSKRIFDKFHLKMGFAEANRIICFTKRLTDLEGEYVMAKNYEYKKATIADIDELVRTRIIVLRTAINYRMMWICHWWKKNPMNIIRTH